MGQSSVMQKALDYYHQHDDYRAVFLRAYYMITLDVHETYMQLSIRPAITRSRSFLTRDSPGPGAR